MSGLNIFPIYYPLLVQPVNWTTTSFHWNKNSSLYQVTSIDNSEYLKALSVLLTTRDASWEVPGIVSLKYASIGRIKRIRLQKIKRKQIIRIPRQRNKYGWLYVTNRERLNPTLSTRPTTSSMNLRHVRSQDFEECDFSTIGKVETWWETDRYMKVTSQYIEARGLKSRGYLTNCRLNIIRLEKNYTLSRKIMSYVVTEFGCK